VIIVATPRAHVCVRGPVWKAARAWPLNWVVRRHFGTMTNVPRERRASPIFLAWAWGSTAVVLGSIALSVVRALPGWLEPAIFSGVAGVALTGAIVAAGYIASSFRMRARVLAAVVPFAINTAFLALVLWPHEMIK